MLPSPAPSSNVGFENLLLSTPGSLGPELEVNFYGAAREQSNHSLNSGSSGEIVPWNPEDFFPVHPMQEEDWQARLQSAEAEEEPTPEPLPLDTDSQLARDEASEEAQQFTANQFLNFEAEESEE
jgi:hypothetical protein